MTVVIWCVVHHQVDLFVWVFGLHGWHESLIDPFEKHVAIHIGVIVPLDHLPVENHLAGLHCTAVSLVNNRRRTILVDKYPAVFTPGVHDDRQRSFGVRPLRSRSTNVNVTIPHLGW